MRRTSSSAATASPAASTEPAARVIDGDTDGSEQVVYPTKTHVRPDPDNTVVAASAGSTAPSQRPVRRSRAGSLWVGLLAAAVVVIALIIFIAQNSQQADITFLGLHGHFSLALALIVATIGGVLLVAIPGSLRILQLRHALKKNARPSN